MFYLKRPSPWLYISIFVQIVLANAQHCSLQSTKYAEYVNLHGIAKFSASTLHFCTKLQFSQLSLTLSIYQRVPGRRQYPKSRQVGKRTFPDC